MIVLAVIVIYILIGVFVLGQMIAEDGDYSLFGYQTHDRWGADEYIVAAGYTFIWPILILGLAARKISKSSRKEKRK